MKPEQNRCECGCGKFVKNFRDYATPECKERDEGLMAFGQDCAIEEATEDEEKQDGHYKP